jgi:hypothetical protein
MCNSVILGDNLPKAKKGSEVEVTIRGIIVDEDGERKIDITHVEDEEVGSMEKESCGCDKPHHGGEMPSAEDALITFIKLDKPKKK